MKKTITAIAALTLCTPAFAEEEKPAAPSPSPNEIVNAAPQSDWIAIPAEDLLVMTLAPDADGNERKVVMQLMPRPFSQGWVENIRTLARADWYDGITVNRVQENYVVQWGDPGHDNPEDDSIEKKPLPDGLNVMTQDQYVQVRRILPGARRTGATPVLQTDSYADQATFEKGFPIALSNQKTDDFRGRNHGTKWPVHCYGMVGVGRSYSPDAGSGAELYTVIGHAPRHLDRNIALVGRIISGMEHLSSLPRGSGALGFYTAKEAGKRTPIVSIRVASDLAKGERPLFEYLSTKSDSFAAYAYARAYRRDPFFIAPAGGADICNIPVPVRPFEYTDDAEE